MKKIIILIISLFIIIGCTNIEDENKIKVVSTIFPGFDFARAVGSDNIDLTMLIQPGSESHTYDPTPKDIIKIQSSDIFIYVGGESEEWVSGILENISSTTKVIRLMDIVEVKEEEIIEGMEHNHDTEHDHETEYDEHIWTSPINAIKIIEEIKQTLIMIDSQNSVYYENNASIYIDKLNQIDNDIKEVINNSQLSELVFGDRFPFRYFVDEYNLGYKAVFPGCSSDIEASSKTITYLVDYIKEHKIPVVFYIELSNQNIATTLAEETNVKKLPFYSAHNLTKEEFDKGVTYVDLMNQNIINLKEALKYEYN